MYKHKTVVLQALPRNVARLSRCSTGNFNNVCKIISNGNSDVNIFGIVLNNL